MTSSSQIIWPLIKRTKSLRVADIWLLRPYSPDWNPIERLWSKIKTSLRQVKATTVEIFRQAARRALKTNTDIRGWISHSHYLQVA